MTKYILEVEKILPLSLEGLTDKSILICRAVFTDRDEAYNMFKLLTKEMKSYRISLSLEISMSKEVLIHNSKGY